MKGWNWSIANKGQKPQVVGHYINNYVYSRLAPQVLTELRKLNPKDDAGKRKGKHTQWIDIDFGHPKLKEHLSVLMALARASGHNWKNWDRMVERALPKFEQDGSQQQYLDL
jgi:P63C domain